MQTMFRLLIAISVGAMMAAGLNASPPQADQNLITDTPTIRFTSQDEEELAIESPSDLEPVPEPEVPGVDGVTDASKTSDKGKGGGKDGGFKGLGGRGLLCGSDTPPWGIPQPALLKDHGIKIGGWLQQGITFNDHNSADGFNGPVATNDRNAEYQVNQLWMYITRPVNTGGCGWDIGGHVDMVYGTDWRFGINEGLETEINGFNGQMYGLVIPQAYLEVAYNDLSVKLGHFAGILDYEAVPAPMNPFYSHSYSYGYTVPQLVTGALADWKATDNLSLQAGVHRGWLMFEDNNNKLDIMAGMKWQSSDQRTSIAYAISSGPQWSANSPPFIAAPGDQNDRFVYSLVIQRQVTDRLKYVLVHNLGWEEGIAGQGGSQDAEWYGINQYLLYNINRCWAANFRFEWMRDDDGRRIAGPGNIQGVKAWNGWDNAGNFFNITAGASWRPTANWLVRPEVRYDWFDGPAGTRGLPFGGNDDQLTFAVDAVLFF